MLRVGLTGGIGSGKSIIAQFFHELGAKVIDADEIAKELTAIQQPAYFEILDRYGSGILTDNKELNRKKLREIIFNNLEEKRWLENLLHPLILKQIEQESNDNSIYCIIVIPLLIETNAYNLVDRVLVIDTPIKEQVDRVRNRDKISKETVLKIIESQATREQRLSVADDIILNNKGIFELKNQVYNLHLKYCQIGIENG